MLIKTSRWLLDKKNIILFLIIDSIIILHENVIIRYYLKYMILFINLFFIFIFFISLYAKFSTTDIFLYLYEINILFLESTINLEDTINWNILENFMTTYVCVWKRDSKFILYWNSNLDNRENQYFIYIFMSYLKNLRMSSHFERIHVVLSACNIVYRWLYYTNQFTSKERKGNKRGFTIWRGERVNYMRLDDDEDKYLSVIASKIVEFSISCLYRELNFSIC